MNTKPSHAFGELYDALLLWADRGLKLANPSLVFLIILALIVLGLEISLGGWRARRSGQNYAGLLLTAAAASLSAVSFLAVRNGGGGLTPNGTLFMPYFFGFAALLALGCLGAEIILHFRFRRKV